MPLPILAKSLLVATPAEHVYPVSDSTLHRSSAAIRAPTSSASSVLSSGTCTRQVQSASDQAPRQTKKKASVRSQGMHRDRNAVAGGVHVVASQLCNTKPTQVRSSAEHQSPPRTHQGPTRVEIPHKAAPVSSRKTPPTHLPAKPHKIRAQANAHVPMPMPRRVPSRAWSASPPRPPRRRLHTCAP